MSFIKQEKIKTSFKNEKVEKYQEQNQIKKIIK
jgi:hypothetical protein